MSFNVVTAFSTVRKAFRRNNLTVIPTYSRSKDIASLPFVPGHLPRHIWRVWMYRFTPASGYFMLVTLLFMAYGSNSLNIQAYVPFAYLFTLWMLALACAKLFRPRVALKAEHAERVCAGETLPLEIEIRQLRRRYDADLTIIPHRLPAALDAEPEDGVATPALAFGEKRTLRLGLRCSRRGVHLWRGFRVETDYPLGLIRAFRTYEESRRVLVYPKFTPLARLNIPAGRRYQPGGVALASNLGESFEYIGNREYREGDSIRDMDWRATARLNIPVVREYREEYFLRVGVVLDTYVPPQASPEDRENFERAVSVSAAVSDFMARSDYLVDIFAAGPNLYHLTAGRSLAYLDQILDILACVDENPDEPFSELEPELLESLAKITTVVCVFMDWNEARRAFVEKLRREGTGLKVIIVRDSPCALDPRDSDLPNGITVISHAGFQAGVEEI